MLAGKSFKATSMMNTSAEGSDNARMRLAKPVSFSIANSLLCFLSNIPASFVRRIKSKKR